MNGVRTEDGTGAAPPFRHWLCLLALVLIYPVLIGCFHLLELGLEPEYFTEAGVDSLIPFVPEFILPYLAWFPLVVGTVAFFLFASPREYIQLLGFLYIGMAVSLVIFLLFPNGQNLRPNHLGAGVFEDAVRYIYSIDTPTNSAPSIHVVETVGIFAAVAQSRRLRHRRWVVPAMGVLCLLIIVSTVCVKQHAVLDLGLGLGIGLALWGLVYHTSFLDPVATALLTPSSGKGWGPRRPVPRLRDEAESLVAQSVSGPK